MAVRVGLRGEPRSFLAAGGTWPSGPFVADVPVSVRYAAAISAAIAEALQGHGWTVTRAAAEVGMGRQALHAILSGRVMPDLHTLARAEQVLGTRLWPTSDFDGTD